MNYRGDLFLRHINQLNGTQSLTESFCLASLLLFSPPLSGTTIGCDEHEYAHNKADEQERCNEMTHKYKTPNNGVAECSQLSSCSRP